MTAAPELPGGYRLVALETTDSTNAHAARLALAGEAKPGEVTVVWALEQSAGRGRFDRVWTSPPGNLYCSFLSVWDGAVADAAKSGFAAGLAVRDTVAEFAPKDCEVTLKWPNDILINGAKAGGILLESRAQGGRVWLIVGIGLNLASHPEGTPYPATSLAAAGAEVAPGETLASLCRHFQDWRGRWRREGFEVLRAAWLDAAAGLGGSLAVDLGDETVTGVFSGLGADGALILETASGSRSISVGDVFFPAPETKD